MSLATVFYFVFIGIALVIVGTKAIVITRSNERAVVFRLGKYVNVRSAGVVMIVPFLDQVVKVRADQIAGSERMSEEQLLQRIAQIYQSD